MATKERAEKNTTRSATGVDSGAGPQENPPVVGRLKTPVFRGVEVSEGRARNTLFRKAPDINAQAFEAVRRICAGMPGRLERSVPVVVFNRLTLLAPTTVNKPFSI